MIKSIYNSIRENIFFRIENFHTNINTKDRAELSDYFSNLLSNKILEGNKVFSEINSINILKMEQQNKIIVDILTEIKDNTKKLITEIERIKPDIICLNNLHGYYINIEVLFKYLSKSNSVK
jgi:hypothetical protein